MASVARRVGCAGKCSPLRMPNTSSTALPHTICAAVFIAPGGISRWRLHAEPSAHAAAAASSAMAPSGEPDRLLPRFNTMTPAKPMTSPTVSRRFGHSPYRPMNSAANNGMLATATAAMPELTRCSAKHTRPLPRPSSNTLLNAALRHCNAVGAAMPRMRKKPYIATPAHRKRNPASRNGG